MIDDGQPIEIAFPPLGGKWPIIYERADCDAVPGAIMDACWAEGWRHFGREFYRYSAQPDGANLMRVLPLRIEWCLPCGEGFFISGASFASGV